jgi:hypothetical protein
VLLDFKRFLACTSRCPGDGAAEREEVENKEVEARNAQDLTHWVHISSFVSGVCLRVCVFPRVLAHRGYVFFLGTKIKFAESKRCE